MISLLISLFFTNLSFADEQMLNIGWGCDVRVVVENPQQQEPKADVLFLIGFSDRADNHGPLFSQLTQSGFRVISFDYPSHGKTKCRSIGVYDIMSLARLARSVLQNPGIQSDRPLYIGGWSTGGLLAYRMMQQKFLHFREVKGLILLAPGIAVYKIPGDGGVVTQESLLSNPNPPHLGDISPTSPLLSEKKRMDEVDYHMDLGLKFKDKAMYKMCIAEFAHVLQILNQPNNKKYQLAKEQMKECRLSIQEGL